VTGKLSVLALVTDAFGGRGGIAQYNRGLLEAMAAHPRVGRIDVLPRVSPDEPGQLPPGIRQFGATSGRAAFAMAATRCVLRQRYDFIYNGHLYLSPLSALLAAWRGIPMLSQLHGTEIWSPPSLFRRKGLERSRAVLCVSRDTLAKTLGFIDVDPERLAVLPNTVDPCYSLGDRDAARSKFGLDKQRVLLTVARLDAREGYKGHDRVIDALPRLLEKDPHIIYLIAGEGNDRARLEARVADRGVSRSVRFLGYVPFRDLPDLYRAVDVFVMPSTGEGFGIVYLEAMACGTQAVGFAVGGAGDALCDGQLGHVATAETLGETIWSVLERQSDRSSLAASVARRFGPAVFERQLHALIERWFGPANGDRLVSS
jgi:phosphatidylinositol alpha-1,6-mannosyltransferase